VRLIPNGIPPLPAADEDLRRSLGIADDAPVIGTLTVLRPEKALDTLVEAASQLAQRFPGLKVLIAGAGREEERLRTLISAHRLEETVLLLGFRRNVSDVLAALDVAVCCSEREGSPLAVLESMAAARPIVATSVGGIPQLVRDGREALLVPPRDPVALADALSRLLSDPGLRAELGHNARERQQLEFDIRSMVRSFEQLYEELFRTTRRGRGEAQKAAT
jgi:glycosyltransferase involved in cell wall biosynthesis